MRTWALIILIRVKLSFYGLGLIFRVKHLFTTVSVQLIFLVLLFSIFMVLFFQWFFNGLHGSHDSLARILYTLFVFRKQTGRQTPTDGRSIFCTNPLFWNKNPSYAMVNWFIVICSVVPKWRSVWGLGIYFQRWFACQRAKSFGESKEVRFR